MTKKQIAKYAGYCDRYALEDATLAKVKEIVEGWITQYGPDITLSIGGEDVDFSFTEYVEETDDEYAFRLKCEQATREHVEKYERETLERLQAKYGKGN